MKDRGRTGGAWSLKLKGSSCRLQPINGAVSPLIRDCVSAGAEGIVTACAEARRERTARAWEVAVDDGVSLERELWRWRWIEGGARGEAGLGVQGRRARCWAGPAAARRGRKEILAQKAAGCP
jgi:hypothetical protein